MVWKQGYIGEKFDTVVAYLTSLGCKIEDDGIISYTISLGEEKSDSVSFHGAKVFTNSEWYLLNECDEKEEKGLCCLQTQRHCSDSLIIRVLQHFGGNYMPNDCCEEYEKIEKTVDN